MHLISRLFLRIVALAFGVSGLATPAVGQDVSQGQNAVRWRAWLNHRAAGPDHKAFPRFAWSYFGYVKDEDSVRELGAYADAGFVDVQMRMKDDLLTQAGGAGLGLILGTWEGTVEQPDRFDALLRRANSDRTVSMVIVKDEPDQKSLDRIGQLNSRLLTETDARVLPMLTVLPAHASGSSSGSRFDPKAACERTRSYCDFVRRIVAVAKPSAILPTLYAIYEDGSVRSDFYEQLREVRDLTRAQGIGQFGSVLVTSHFDGWSKKMYRRASRADIFWQAYSHISFNAKGLSIYNYRTKPTDFQRPPSMFGEGVVTSREAKPTDIYRDLQDLNCQLGALGKTFLQLDAQKVYGVGMPNQKGLEDGLPSAIHETKGSGFLLSEMKGRADNAPYVLVVNARHESGAPVNEIALHLRPGQRVKRHSVGPQCRREEVWQSQKDGWLRIKLEAGHGALLQVVEDESAGPAVGGLQRGRPQQ